MKENFIAVKRILFAGHRINVRMFWYFHPFSWVFFAMVLAFLLIASAGQNRKTSSKTQSRLCESCGTAHPNFAVFCRRCGKKL
jgi:uncharacterized paraquat-inducible protein A